MHREALARREVLVPLPFMQDESSLRQCIGAFAMVLSEYVGGGRRVKFRAFFGEISALSWKIRPPRRATSRPIRAPSPSVAEDQAPAQATSRHLLNYQRFQPFQLYIASAYLYYLRIRCFDLS